MDSLIADTGLPVRTYSGWSLTAVDTQELAREVPTASVRVGRHERNAHRFGRLRPASAGFGDETSIKLSALDRSSALVNDFRYA